MVIDDEVEASEVENLSSKCMVLIHKMHSEGVVNNKLRDKLKDMTFDEDLELL